MRFGILFSCAATLLLLLAVVHGEWHSLAIWPAGSLAIVSLGYFWIGPQVYGKTKDGRLSSFNTVLLLPYLLYVWCIWHLIRCFKSENAFDQLTDSIIIGRRLLSHELPDGVDHVVDLTCEFPEPAQLVERDYHSLQILDGHIPTAEQLHDWANQISNLSGTIYIHCAEGHGRTGLVAASVLIQTGLVSTPQEAIELLQSKRPLVKLSLPQRAALEDFRIKYASAE